MPITLLLDLDDTLLRNNIDSFLPAYLKLLGQHFDHRYPDGLMIRELLTATNQMITNQKPGSTLEEVFSQAFYPALGTTKEAMRSDLDTFYAQEYPMLSKLTEAQPGVVTTVESAFSRGYQIIIATNPLFPATAIEQRLEWAGLNPKKYPFTLITNYENMHFAKPHLAYFAEILAQQGWSGQPVVMVGNTFDDDILPARKMGIATYHFVPGQPFTLAAADAYHASGDFEGLIPWLKDIENRPYSLPREPEALLPALRATPAALASLTHSFPTTHWNQAPKPGEWSITEVIAHLRDVDQEVNLPRIQRVLEQDNPFLPGVDSDPWAIQRGYAQQNGQNALHEFTTTRVQIINLLADISAQQWQRPARHAIFGPSRLMDLVEIMFTHDRNHLQQIRENIAALQTTSHSQSG